MLNFQKKRRKIAEIRAEELLPTQVPNGQKIGRRTKTIYMTRGDQEAMQRQQKKDAQQSEYARWLEAQERAYRHKMGKGYTPTVKFK